MNASNGKITTATLLVPVSLLAFVLFLFVAFQVSLVLRDRDTLRTLHSQQDKPIEDAQKVQTQVQALVSGVQKLSTQGDKDAQQLIERMKQLGVFGPSAAPGSTGSAMPNAAPSQP